MRGKRCNYLRYKIYIVHSLLDYRAKVTVICNCMCVSKNKKKVDKNVSEKKRSKRRTLVLTRRGLAAASLAKAWQSPRAAATTHSVLLLSSCTPPKTNTINIRNHAIPFRLCGTLFSGSVHVQKSARAPRSRSLHYVQQNIIYTQPSPLGDIINK